jgi:hypothetical protein
MRVDITFATAATPTAGAAFAATTDAEKRTIEGVAVPFGVPSGPSADGFRYQFSGPPTNADELVDIVDEHNDDAVVGRLAAPFDAADDAARARARIFNTTRGNDLLEETREGVKTGFSVSAAFDAFDEDADGIRHVGDWQCLHLGVVRRPAFQEAAGLTLAASASKEKSMTETAQAGAQTAAPHAVELPTVAELAAQVAEFQAEATKKGQHPLARFSSRTHFLAAFQEADEEGRQKLAAEFALVDQITGNNPGVMAPQWRTDIKMQLDARRPAIAATGGAIGLPDSGLSVSWPYFDGTLDGMIAEQAAEKTELNSVRVDIKSANASLRTAGVASDISYQLIMRSSPSYLGAYQTITEAAWARYTERVYELALIAASTELTALPADLTTAAGADTFWSLLFQGSAEVEDATGAPASAVLVSSDVWLELGGNPSFRKNDNNDSASASSLSINTNGLTITRAPFFDNGTVLMLNEQAAKFAEQGPMVATEENVAKLGRDVATWGMYIPAEVYFPAGLVRFDRTA